MFKANGISKEIQERLPGLLLLALTLGVYWQVHDFGFIYFDDPEYVIQNTNIQRGLTWESFSWALTSFYFSNWHPLTWLSYMLDYRLFRLNPAGYHLMNVFLHAANVLLLFLVLREATGDRWRSFAVAVLFGLHPLHVESVVWISERKDVLSAFFWMLTLLAYIRYAKSSAKIWYGAALLFFVLGLMSKPMLVTLPFVLLLLDYWPLKRMVFFKNEFDQERSFQTLHGLVLEKLPFFLLSLASSLVTYVAQTKGGAVQSFDLFPLAVRIGNATLAYFGYLFKTVWPLHLTIFYPHPGLKIPLWQVLGAFGALALLSFWIFRRMRTKPFLAVGWLWFLGTLVPVIGIIQVGAQSMADRYTYIPLIGIFMALIWMIPARPVMGKPLWAAIQTLIIILCIGLTWFQIGYWRDTVSLFENNLKLVGENAAAHYILFQAKRTLGDPTESRKHYDLALSLNPRLVAKMHNKNGYLLFNAGDVDPAIQEFRRALQIQPGYVHGRNNLAIALAMRGQLDESAAEFAKVLVMNPANEEARGALRDLLLRKKAQQERTRGKK